MIRVLLVDDEPLAREELGRLLSAHSDIQVAGQAADGAEALRKMKEDPVDVVFLDIDMPVMNGLEVAGNLAEWKTPPAVIFATAYDKYAVEAFEANAVDYLLKPFDDKRLAKALIKVKERLRTRKPSQEEYRSLESDLIRRGLLKKLVGHRRGSKDRIVLDPAEVLYFHADLADVFAFPEAGEFIVGMTLKDLTGSLNPAQFMQTHKSYLVNLGKIEKVSPLFSGNFEITLKDPKHTRIPLSRRYATAVKDAFGKW